MIISMQDMRLRLAEIAKRAESGEDFIVIRNSRPSFRIVPAHGNALRKEDAAAILEEAALAMRASPVRDGEITDSDVMEAVRAVRRQKKKPELKNSGLATAP